MLRRQDKLWSGLIGGITTLATATVDMNILMVSAQQLVCVFGRWKQFPCLPALFIFCFMPVVIEHGFGTVSSGQGDKYSIVYTADTHTDEA